MEIKAFLIRFEKTLTENGFSTEAARHHTLRVAKSLSESDKNRIHAFKSESEAVAIARSYASKLRKKNESVAEKDELANTANISSTFKGTIPEGPDETVRVYKGTHSANDGSSESSSPEEASTMMFTSVKKENVDSSRPDSYADNVKTMKIDAVKPNGERDGAPQRPSVTDGTENSKTKNIAKVPVSKKKMSPEAKKEFTKQLAARSPFIILGFIGAGVASFTVYALIALLIAAFIALLICVIIVGGVGTLAGFIYGVIKLFSVIPEGLYEIGFALVVAGITMALSICSYNVAVRLIPILWKKFTYFLTDCLNKFRTYIRKIRRECADK